MSLDEQRLAQEHQIARFESASHDLAGSLGLEAADRATVLVALCICGGFRPAVSASRSGEIVHVTKTVLPLDDQRAPDRAVAIEAAAAFLQDRRHRSELCRTRALDQRGSFEIAAAGREAKEAEEG